MITVEVSDHRWCLRSCLAGGWVSLFTMLLAVGCDQPPDAAPAVRSALTSTAAPAPGGIRGTPVRAVRVATRRFEELGVPGGLPAVDRSIVPPPRALPERPPGAVTEPRAVAALPAPTMPSPALSANFLGAPSAGVPPDTMGAVGPDHLMVTINGLVQILNKTGQVLSSTSLSGFFQAVAPGGPFGDTFDPSALYDPLGQRFVVICMAERESPSSSVLMAVSQSTDPTGAWHFYAFDVDPDDVGWSDFGKLGVNARWVFTHTPINDTQQSQMLVCDKAALYAGTDSCTQFTPTEMRSRPVISHDADSTTAYFLRLVTLPFDGTIAIDTVTGPVGAEVLTMNAFTLTLPESFSTQSGELMPQLGSPVKLWGDPGGNVSTLILRDGSFWGSMTACLPLPDLARCGIRWFQSTPTGTLQQYGGIDDPSNVFHSTYASMAVNKNHDLLIGFARFSAEQYPAAAYAFRAGSDPANTLRGDAVYRPGESSYGIIRWGDYTISAVDPSNDLDMWTLQQFAVGGGFDYNLQWARVTPPGPSAAATIAPVADAYVQDGGSATSNFGAATSLLVKATASTGTNRWTYLRFPLSAVGGGVTTARLRLYGSRPSANGIPDLVYSVASNGWTETGITWNNRPPVGAAQDFGVAIHSNAHYYEWDVTPFVRAQKAAGASAVSLAVRMRDNVSIGPDSFASREASSNRPQLVVVFDSAATVALAPEADAHARDGASANTNFGTATALEQKNSTVVGNNRRTFVRFPIGSVGSTVTAATLRLHGSSVTSAKLVGVYAVPNVTWGETTITFNNAPAIGAKQGASQTVGTTATTVTWDVTAYVQARKAAGASAVTFELKQDVANNQTPTTFSAREATSNRPALVVTSN